MGKTTEKAKKSGSKFISFIFHIIFALFFLALTVIATLFVISYLGIQTNGSVETAVSKGWEWATKIPYVQSLYEWCVSKGDNSNFAHIGVILLFVGADITFIYFTIMFLLKKIPVLGTLIKWLTGIIPSISVLMIIIGLVLMFMF